MGSCCNSGELPDRNCDTLTSQDALLNKYQHLDATTNASNVSDDIYKSKRTWSETDKWKDDDVVGDLNIAILAKKYKTTPRTCTNSLGILDVTPLGIIDPEDGVGFPTILISPPQTIDTTSLPEHIEDTSDSCS